MTDEFDTKLKEAVNQNFKRVYPEISHIDDNTLELGETGIKLHGKGHYYVIQGCDLGWFARAVQRLMEAGFEPNGAPFLLNDTVCQAMTYRATYRK